MKEKEYVFVGTAQLKTRDYIKQLENENKEKDKEIERLNNIINKIEKIMLVNKEYYENAYKISSLSAEDFRKQHPYTSGMHDNDVNLLGRLQELKGSKSDEQK